MARTFTFIGVTTQQSSIMRIFPRWRDLLGLGSDVEMVGRDLPLHAPAEQYRAVVDELRRNEGAMGALVTTHKIDLYNAAGDLFVWVDSYARLCGEVSCIARRADGLHGWAKDPTVAGRALHRILGDGYFDRTGGEVLCLGAGGAGVALTLHLMTRPERGDRPRRIVVTDRSGERLEHMRRLHETLQSDVEVTYVRAGDAGANDARLESAAPGSVVVNATGMGKDVPGSPISSSAVFPRDAVAWELNYRGELDFLHQAWDQREARNVRVEDGWNYFIYGWTAVMEEVFQRPIPDDDLAALSAAAAFARPDLPTHARAG